MHTGEPVLQLRTGERRRHRGNTGFPLTDSAGVLVLADRRMQPGCSLENMEAEWREITFATGNPE